MKLKYVIVKSLGFTIVELLVVVTTGALFMAILLPLLRISRWQAKTVICRSNVKQLTFGFFMYENQNQTLPYGFYRPLGGPPPGGYAGYGQYDRKGWWWFNLVGGFYKKSDDKTVLQCPSKRLNNDILKKNILCGNYGVNRSICKSFDDILPFREDFVGTPLSTRNIIRPAETLLIIDSGYAVISWWHATDEPPWPLEGTLIEDTAYIPGLKINKDRDLWSGQERDAIYGRHPNKTVNTGFVDGHVARMKADELLVEKIEDDYKNKSPLWAPK